MRERPTEVHLETTERSYVQLGVYYHCSEVFSVININRFSSSLWVVLLVGSLNLIIFYLLFVFFLYLHYCVISYFEVSKCIFPFFTFHTFPISPTSSLYNFPYFPINSDLRSLQVHSNLLLPLPNATLHLYFRT